MRAKVGAIAPRQKAVQRRCRGFQVQEGESGNIPQVYFADDGVFLTNSFADLQVIYDINWIMARMVGLQIKVKGAEKTAYSAVRYVSGIAHNLEGVDKTLLDGTVIPQLLVPDTMHQQATYSTKQTGTGHPQSEGPCCSSKSHQHHRPHRRTNSTRSDQQMRQTTRIDIHIPWHPDTTRMAEQRGSSPREDPTQSHSSHPIGWPHSRTHLRTTKRGGHHGDRIICRVLRTRNCPNRGRLSGH